MTRPAIILVVAMAHSIHTFRWLNAAAGKDLRLVLMPIETRYNNAHYTPVRVRADVEALPADRIGLWMPDGLRPQPDMLPPPLESADRTHLQPGAAVSRAIRLLKPDLVHSMELQGAGYSCLSSARQLGMDFPRWMVSNWGSDLSLYSKLSAHRPVLAEIMKRAGAYHCECCRDSIFARQIGFIGRLLGPLPASGGIDHGALPERRPPSQRREIMIKGYHGWAGRGMHILSALHLVAPALRGFRIFVRHTRDPMGAMIDALREKDGLDIAVEPYLASYQASLERLAQARISVSLGISAGIDTTFLESMSLGTFPITTSASCAGDWIDVGRDGFIVGPHDVAELARVVTRAAEDDKLVDDAAQRNQVMAARHWDAATNGRLVRQFYRDVLDDPGQGACASEGAGT